MISNPCIFKEKESMIYYKDSDSIEKLRNINDTKNSLINVKIQLEILRKITDTEKAKEFLSIYNKYLSDGFMEKLRSVIRDNYISCEFLPLFKTVSLKSFTTLMDQLSKLIEDAISESKKNAEIEIMLSDVEIITQDIPGWVVTNEADLTVALDTTITDSLRQEGISRELVNRIQNIRKEQNFDVTDNIIVEIQQCELLCQAVDTFKEYICSETLTKELKFVDAIENPLQTIDVIEGKELAINIRKA